MESLGHVRRSLRQVEYLTAVRHLEMRCGIGLHKGAWFNKHGHAPRPAAYVLRFLMKLASLGEPLPLVETVDEGWVESAVIVLPNGSVFYFYPYKVKVQMVYGNLWAEAPSPRPRCGGFTVEISKRAMGWIDAVYERYEKEVAK